MIDIVENRNRGLAGHIHLVKVTDLSRITGDLSPAYSLYTENDVRPICPVCGYRIDPDSMHDVVIHRYKASRNAVSYVEFSCGNCKSVFRTDPFIYDREATSCHLDALSSTENVRFFKTPKEMDKYIKPGFGKFELDSDPLWPIFVVPILIILALAMFEGVLLHDGGSIYIGPLEITTKLLIVLMCICAAISTCHFFISKLRNGREYKLPRK